jgi:hypothetical protein
MGQFKKEAGSTKQEPGRKDTNEEVLRFLRPAPAFWLLPPVPASRSLQRELANAAIVLSTEFES